jgi:hypothetical protein
LDSKEKVKTQKAKGKSEGPNPHREARQKETPAKQNAIGFAFCALPFDFALGS